VGWFVVPAKIDWVPEPVRKYHNPAETARSEFAERKVALNLPPMPDEKIDI
jgi:hypothetical protein